MNRDARIAVTGIMAAILKGFDLIATTMANVSSTTRSVTMNHVQAAEKADQLYKSVVTVIASE